MSFIGTVTLDKTFVISLLECVKSLCTTEDAFALESFKKQGLTLVANGTVLISLPEIREKMKSELIDKAVEKWNGDADRIQSWINESDDHLVIDMLRARGLVKEEEIKEACAEAQLRGVSVVDALIALGRVSEDQVMALLAAEYGMDTYKFDDKGLSPQMLAVVPGEIARRYRIMPVSLSEGVLTVAMWDPSDLEALDSLRYILRVDVEGVVASKKEIEKAIDRYYPEGNEDFNGTIIGETEEGFGPSVVE